MNIHEIEETPTGNPFLNDAFNMGIQIGKNVHIMMGNHENEHCTHLYVIDTICGKKVRIDFPMVSSIRYMEAGK